MAKLSEERKHEIDELASLLRYSYSVNSESDIKSIAKDFGIVVLETEKIGMGSAVKRKNNHYLILPKRLVPSYGKYQAAHELGHMLLYHFLENQLGLWEREDEADYFARRLIGMSRYKCECARILESLLYTFIHPINTFKVVSGIHRKDANKLIDNYEAQNPI